MIKIAIFGLGQAGNALTHLLSANYQIVGCFDNDNRKWGKFFLGTIVMSPDKIMEIDPEIVWIGTLNSNTANAIEKQIRKLGFKGIIKHTYQLKESFDLRLAQLRLMAREIENRKVEGAIAELGVYQGDFAKELNYNFPDRKLYLFDTFEGFHKRDLFYEKEFSQGKKSDFSDTSIRAVWEKLPHPDRVEFLKGRFPMTIPEIDVKYAFISLDADLYEPTRQGLEYFYPRLSEGGAIFIHDYNSRRFPGVKKAVDEYIKKLKLFIIPLCDFHGTAILAKV